MTRPTPDAGPHPHGPTMALRAFVASLEEGEGRCESRMWPEGLLGWSWESGNYPKLYRVREPGEGGYPVNYWCEDCVRPFERLSGCDFAGETPLARWSRQAHEALFCPECGRVALWPQPSGVMR